MPQTLTDSQKPLCQLKDCQRPSWEHSIRGPVTHGFVCPPEQRRIKTRQVKE